MGKVSTLISERMNNEKPLTKMAEMARESAQGKRSSFSGIFTTIELNESEKDSIEAILLKHATGKENILQDTQMLTSITSEVKAINNQAALLHGERIKKAQNILKKYQEGAFTAWLMTAYGNRQTPYNFLMYYDFFERMPKILRPQIELMPRQAIYTLASREGKLEKKEEIVKNYHGQTKTELLTLIRETFPLDDEDKRKRSVGNSTIIQLERLCSNYEKRTVTLTKREKKLALELLEQLRHLIETSNSH